MPRPLRRLRWYIAGLLFLSTVINYIDRQTLSVLAPVLKTEFRWTNADFALVVDAFRLAYALGQTGSGRWLDRVGTRTGLSLAVAFYSASAMLVVARQRAAHFAAFRSCGPGRVRELARRNEGGCRMVSPPGERMGRGAVRQRFVRPAPRWRVHRAVGPSDDGSWRPAFIVTGMLGLLWIPLFRWLYRSPAEHPRLSAEERRDILANRAPAAADAPDTPDTAADSYRTLLSMPRPGAS